MKIPSLPLLSILAGALLMGGCSSVCTKPDEGYTQNSPECRRFCADADCKYWGHSKDEADSAFEEGLRLQNEMNQKACKAKGVAPDTKAMTACIRDQEKQHAMTQIQNSKNAGFLPNTYYLEK